MSNNANTFHTTIPNIYWCYNTNIHANAKTPAIQQQPKHTSNPIHVNTLFCKSQYLFFVLAVANTSPMLNPLRACKLTWALTSSGTPSLALLGNLTTPQKDQSNWINESKVWLNTWSVLTHGPHGPLILSRLGANLLAKDQEKSDRVAM